MMDDGEMMFDREFMMNIFEPIVDQVEPFAEYLEFIFENKEGHALGSREKANKWLPFDELHAEHSSFYSERKMHQNLERNSMRH
jgi:hypothetical protein